MSTYKGKTYDSKAYLSYRPTYPSSSFAYSRQYIGLNIDEKVKKAADLGCGSGQATIAIAQNIAEDVVGVDMSPYMLEQGYVNLENASKDDHQLSHSVAFIQSDDRSFPDVFAPHSLDLVTIAEAAHWFEYPELWNSCHLVSRRGGVLAFWAYYSFSFEKYPDSGEIFRRFSLGEDKCGPYWDSGQSHLNNMYDDLQPPENLFCNEVRIISELNDFGHQGPFELRREDVLVEDMLNLLRTYSAYHNWKRANSDKPDILQETIQELFDKTGLEPDSRVTVKWNSVLVCVRSV